jgi:hypothetical protein
MTIDDEAQSLIGSLKKGERVSSSQAIHHKNARRANTAGELEAAYEGAPPPNIDLGVLGRIIKDRGRRSGGRK